MKSFFIMMILIFSVSNSLSQGLSGLVKAEETRSPIPFATILLIDLDLATSTDSVGNFNFSNSLPAKVRLKVTAPGFESKIIELRAGTDTTLLLREKHIELDEVTISDSKGTLQKYNAIHIETRKLKDLNAISSTNLGEALSSIPGVYSTSTGLGISKPVIRGLQGMRVVTMLNGLRIENQQWGGDHGMGLTDLGIGSVEVIKGPASLLYGADALGGVVYFIDESYAKQNTYELSVRSQFETNTMGTSDQLAVKLAKQNYRFNVAGSFSNHADFQLPNGRFAENSRFGENALKASFGFNKNNWAMHVRYNFAQSRVGLPGHSHDYLPEPADFQVVDQQRRGTIPAQYFQNHFLSVENKWFMNKFEWNILLGQTANQLTEYEEKITIPGINMLLLNTLYNLRMKVRCNDRLTLLSGIQGMYQQMSNFSNAEETLLPRSTALDNGIYSLLYFESGKWNIQGGIRGDIRIIRSFESYNGSEPIARDFGSLNFSLGAVRSVEKSTFRANVSSGFRAPHLSEILANGFHHGALRYEIGNLDLKNERATQLDITYELHGQHIELILNPFATYIQRYISIQPMDSLIDGLPVFEYIQLPSVFLTGSDVGVHYHPHFAHWLHLESSVSIIYGRDDQGRGPALMPQNRLNTLVKVSLKTKGTLRFDEIVFQHVYMAPQNLVAEEETRSPYYNLLHAALKMRLGKKNPVMIDLGIKNILNEFYIDHLSRLKNIEMPAPGRNFYISLKYTMSNNLKSNR